MIRKKLIALDTETTGLGAHTGDRIVEIGCVRFDGRPLSGLPQENFFHTCLNPERHIPLQAVAIHGISDESVRFEPVFADVARRFIDFVEGSTLIIHNAPFDTRFLNMELGRLNLGRIEDFCEIVDTVRMARSALPRLRSVSLDNLCRHYGIDNSARTRHGALLDAGLLVEVYLRLEKERPRRRSFF